MNKLKTIPEELFANVLLKHLQSTGKQEIIMMHFCQFITKYGFPLSEKGPYIEEVLNKVRFEIAKKMFEEDLFKNN